MRSLATNLDAAQLEDIHALEKQLGTTVLAYGCHGYRLRRPATGSSQSSGSPRRSSASCWWRWSPEAPPRTGVLSCPAIGYGGDEPHRALTPLPHRHTGFGLTQ